MCSFLRETIYLTCRSTERNPELRLLYLIGKTTLYQFYYSKFKITEAIVNLVKLNILVHQQILYPLSRLVIFLCIEYLKRLAVIFAILAHGRFLPIEASLGHFDGKRSPKNGLWQLTRVALLPDSTFLWGGGLYSTEVAFGLITLGSNSEAWCV